MRSKQRPLRAVIKGHDGQCDESFGYKPNGRHDRLLDPKAAICCAGFIDML